MSETGLRTMTPGFPSVVSNRVPISEVAKTGRGLICVCHSCGDSGTATVFSVGLILSASNNSQAVNSGCVQVGHAHENWPKHIAPVIKLGQPVASTP
jgi:hypothetical protein